MTMKPSISIVVLFLELLALAIIDISFSNRNTHLNCIESEREALLRFKQDLNDPSNRLTSWSGDGDCCTWDGVVCDNLTGHVLQLHLQNPHNDSEVRSFWSSQLGGEISSSISNLSFLSHLNVSNNNLTGRIPLSTQLLSFDASCFAGNELCGDPLPKKCTKTSNSMPNHDERGEDGDEHKVIWFYVSMPIGFVVGFWGVIGPLIFNRRWRYKYCHFLDFIGNKLYYFVKKCC
ncbi:receptor-like protein EIX2 [Pistacia vera]|uniref:receptor-like protein EIX2 n=1 Tax=Pistacia vera TaxID=55513 RepID=UPI001263AEED|nr:receptor-like protein EIX2 [Pistacia vera]